MSLLEVLTATTLMATMMASTVVVLRGSYAAWQAHQADLERAESAHAVLLHVVRQLRQASGLAAPPAADTLSLSMDSGDTYVWQYDAANRRALFGVTTATSLLADDIDGLTFDALQADGSPATTSNETVLVRCSVTIPLPVSGGPTRTISCTGCLRSKLLE